MKLLTKTTVYFLIAMIPLLAASGFLLFNQFTKAINYRVDKELIYEEIQWLQYLEATTGNGSNFILRSPDLLIYPVNEASENYPQIIDVYGTKAKENIQIPYRQLSHVVPVNGNMYQIVIRKSQEQKAALLTNITWVMIFVFAGLLFAAMIFNWFISKKIWQPFKTSLYKIKNIELQKLKSIHFDVSNIQEFSQLNTSLNSMTNKIHQDYESIKEFTENAAHEMQTPLAVAQTKMELLLQDENLKENQTEAIMQASTALSRLSKLNQSLLLLAKIENHQYEAKEDLSLGDVTKKYLNLFEEIIKDKQLKIELDFTEEFMVKLHPFLADSLISNLTGNAIKYNYIGGKIRIKINNKRFCISNTSTLKQIDDEQLFKRFKTSGSQDTSNGLGLAIVKKIIDINDLQIHYKYESDFHNFCIYKV